MKPSLANGELQMIGTTTLKEYRKYIEKDTALERRFQPIIVEEPSVEDAISILQGIKQYYEDYHHVRISNDIIRQIVNMSEKYIHDRFLPDKAIDILDEACSKINLNDKDLYDLEVLNNQLKDVQAKKEEAAQADSTEDYQKAAELKTQECALLEQIDNLKKRMQPKDLTTQDIANVIESWTKIPVNKITEEETKKLIISVSDTGIGIPLEKRGQLFSRFMQSSFSGDSMGIGLHLTHELVNVHKGSIEYAENEGQGSVFTVTLPLDSSVYESKDFLISTALMEETDHTDEGIPCRLVKEEQMAAPLNKKKILIIEDDTDIREFLKKEISVYFEVVAEADGVAGFERARTYDADLIICDVLMPGMNGYEVTRKLKNEFSTSHIPIILLTAMGTTENKLEGVESGADAYVTKPFSLKLLLARMVQLIDQREKLREKYVNDPSIERPAIYTSDKDKQFLDKLQAIIEQELGNSEFTMEDFAARMKLGRTVFSKKVRGLTGHTPNEYFRIIRLKKAAELLLEGNYNVSEVSYKVGISDPLYFSRCFKTHYGVSPSVYLRGKEKEI